MNLVWENVSPLREAVHFLCKQGLRPCCRLPREVRGSAISIPEIAVRFHSLLLLLSLCYLFLKTKALVRPKGTSGFNSDSDSGNEMGCRYRPSVNQIPGVVFWGRKIPHLAHQLSLQRGLTHWGGGLQRPWTSLVNW